MTEKLHLVKEPRYEGRLGWQDAALCAQTDPEAFYPEKGASTSDAKKVCLSCDVRAECLEDALGRNDRFGVLGGLSERERRTLKKQIIAAQAALDSEVELDNGDTEITQVA